MIYGLYLSATGVLTNSYRQDVIANNLANAQTVGFKRTLAAFVQRRTEAAESGELESTNRMLEGIGGGLFVAPTTVDYSQGRVESTGNGLDVAIHGNGFFAVRNGDETSLTRNGRFMLDREGYLALADDSGHRVLDDRGRTISLGQTPQALVNIAKDGTITANGQPLARLALLNVPDPSQLIPEGATLLSGVEVSKLERADGTLQSGFLEESNVDPMTELTQLIQAQRQLEANANMIRYQDQTLSKLVNEAGKIG
jgi:flagellar basal-body rod protein FlgG